MPDAEDADLIQRFVASFERLDDNMWMRHDSPPPEELSAGIDPEDWNRIRWRPAPIDTPRDALSILRERAGAELPRLYEHLVLSYRWLEVELRLFRLLANPPSTELKPLADRMFADPVLNNTLIPARFVRFALAPGGCYDPICFDLNHYSNGDCPIVRFEHESILCHDKIGDSERIFPSFRKMMQAVVKIDART